jgi:1,4-alpha-glucan branching enzyme
MPVMEHPFDASWGYQVTGYFAPTHRATAPRGSDAPSSITCTRPRHRGDRRLGARALPQGRASPSVLRRHGALRARRPRQGEHPDWGTLIFNYGRNEVRNFLTSSARFWLDRFHVDGLRVDAVASMLYLDYSRKEGEWVPNPPAAGRTSTRSAPPRAQRRCTGSFPGVQ